MMVLKILRFSMGALLVLLAACSLDSTQQFAPQKTVSPVATRAVEPPQAFPTTIEARGVPEVRQAVIDLAGRLGLSDAGVEILSVEEILWPDASLGCPRQGSVYAQVITPGYRIKLKAGDEIYEYHTDLRVDVLLCESVKGPGEAPLRGPDLIVEDGYPNQTRYDDVIVVTPGSDKK